MQPGPAPHLRAERHRPVAGVRQHRAAHGGVRLAVVGLLPRPVRADAHRDDRTGSRADRQPGTAAREPGARRSVRGKDDQQLAEPRRRLRSRRSGPTARRGGTPMSAWAAAASICRWCERSRSRPHRIEARIEAFNALNWWRPAPAGSAGANNAPVTNLANVNFGRYLAADDPRIMQFAVKYQF